MSFAEAARWLIHAQAFDTAGIKTGAVGDDRVTNGKGYGAKIAWCGWLGLVIIEGANLFETLMLNLQLGKSLPPAAGDLPVWERDPQGPAVDNRPGAPTGPADLLTWQSRRIRLGHDGERVTGVLIANGDPLHPRDMFQREYMTSWRLSEAQMKATKSADPVYMPRAHPPDRAVWRGLGSLLAETDRDGRTQAARWLEWLDELVDDGALDESYPVRLHTVGMQYGAQSSVIDDITDDQMTLRAAVLADPVLRATAIDAVADVDRTVKVLVRLGSDLTEASGGDRDLCAVARSEAREQGFAALDAPYRRWVLGLGPDIDHDEHRLRWQATVRASIDQLGRDLLNSASTAAWAGLPASAERSQPLNAATAANWFHYNLRKALPVAEQEGVHS
jgi:CRISPR system Cascade subunit CasA